VPGLIIDPVFFFQIDDEDDDKDDVTVSKFTSHYFNITSASSSSPKSTTSSSSTATASATASPSATGSNQTSKSASGSDRYGVAVGVGVGVACLILGLAAGVFWYLRSRKNVNKPGHSMPVGQRSNGAEGGYPLQEQQVHNYYKDKSAIYQPIPSGELSSETGQHELMGPEPRELPSHTTWSRR